MSDRYTLHQGDCLEVLKTLPDGSVDAVITDPPYGLSFMGKRWDASVPSVEVWAECLRVAKPGAHLLSFAGTRTQHRMAVAIEDAGWFIRDMIAWVYGSGFPKSLDVSKAIDKAAGAEREVAGRRTDGRYANPMKVSGRNAGIMGAVVERLPPAITTPATDAARQWQGWGTALKPSLEPITLARKPLDGTVAENVLAHGTGALNIDGCRVETDEVGKRAGGRRPSTHEGYQRPNSTMYQDKTDWSMSPAGRWPANLIHDGSDEVADRLSDAARFFYCAKASKQDRDEGCETLDARIAGCMNMRNDAHAHRTGNTFSPKRNGHPTVKPTDLMRYLCRLVTPPSGIVLDPFMGSGSTGKAAMLEGLRFIGIELEAEYYEVAKRRIKAVAAQRTLDFGGADSA